MIYHAKFGIDLTDEGRHIVEISSFRDYEWSVSQYGSALHWIFKLLNLNIVNFRIFNIVAVFLLGGGCFYAVARNSLGYNNRKSEIIIFTTLSSIFAITFFKIWLPTPNYYSLNFQSLMIFWISISHLINSKNRKFVLFLVSFSLMLIFLAKPTSFIFAILIMITIKIFKIINIKELFLIYLLTGVEVLIYSFIYFGNPVSIFNRIKIGSRMMKTQDPLYSLEHLLRIDPIPFELIYLLLIIAIGILSGLLIKLFSSQHQRSIFWVLSLIQFFIVLAIPVIWYYKFIYLFIVLSIEIFVQNISASMKHVADSHIWLLTFFPLMYAVGSNGNYWHEFESVIFFPALFLLLILFQQRSIYSKFVNLQTPIILLQIIALVCFQNAINAPYRQPNSLNSMHFTIKNESKLRGLILDKERYLYFKRIILVRNLSGLTPGTPFIDFTGESPFVPYLMNAKSLGNPWMVGGYVGSEMLAIESLKLVSTSELSKAWILVAPNGLRSIDDKAVFDSLHAGRNDYVVVGKLIAPKSPNGIGSQQIQYLLKPSDLLNS
jgi:hypothetical protein